MGCANKLQPQHSYNTFKCLYTKSNVCTLKQMSVRYDITCLRVTLVEKSPNIDKSLSDPSSNPKVSKP